MENLQMANEIKGMETLLSNGVNNLAVRDKYIQPLDERPDMCHVSVFERIPVVDLKGLDGPNRRTVIQEIRRACEQHGVFQIGTEFFNRPAEDRARYYSEDPEQLTRVVTDSPNVRTEFLNWRNFLMEPCLPQEEAMSSWPEKPVAYRETAGKYTVELTAIYLKLLAAISEAMGLDSDYLDKLFGKPSQHMDINYYPPCPNPNPDISLGVGGLTDPGGLTVLMQGDLSGLQVLNNGKWVAVEPTPHALVVNLGDQLQTVSNGRFRSVVHRALTNSSTARISIPMFYSPDKDSFIAPAASMIDDQHPAVYRGYKHEEFFKRFYFEPLQIGKTALDQFKVEYPEKGHWIDLWRSHYYLLHHFHLGFT